LELKLSTKISNYNGIVTVNSATSKKSHNQNYLFPHRTPINLLEHLLTEKQSD
jgi:hypothetical protein